MSHNPLLRLSEFFDLLSYVVSPSEMTVIRRELMQSAKVHPSIPEQLPLPFEDELDEAEDAFRDLVTDAIEHSRDLLEALGDE